jgi:5-methylcytosine-specific restriction enzyme B
MPYKPVMKIYFGVPGTGKTFHAAREAVRIIDGAVDSEPSLFTARHRHLVETGRIFWVTFHPSYSYEDFVEGFRPVTDSGGRLSYEVRKGPFKKACEACDRQDPISRIRVGERLGQGGRYEVVEVDSGGVALRSSNERVDAVTDEIVQYADFWTINRLRERGISPEQLSLAGPRNNERQQVARATLLPTTVLTNSSHLRALYERLYGQDGVAGSQPVVLVIDEINRADLSRVFGELITLIEIDKRQGAAEERSIFLPYSKERFSVPLSLSIIGTMNTADRSLAVFDLALRRRFEFIEVEPEPEKCPDDYGGVSVATVIRRWNHRISALLSRDYRIGHSELMENKLEEVRTQHGWLDSDDGRRRALALTVRNKILPMLLEYFHDNWRKAEAILGNRGLLQQVTFEDVAELMGDLVDLSDYSSFIVASWWDPEGGSWDGERFRREIMEHQGNVAGG